MIKKISIIGAGAVGSTLGYNLLSRLNLAELTLIDVAGDLARGIALDLEDTRGFLNFTTKIEGTEDFTKIENSDIVVITAGIPRKDGMSRQDLININAKVAKDVSVHIKKYAKNSIVIVVTNPLDIITYVTLRETGFPRNRVLGMGSTLDTSRLLNIIHNALGFSTSSINGYVFGMHNNDMIVSLEKLKIKGEPITKFIDNETANKLRQRVKMRGGEIVGFLKNRSANFAPALSCCNLIEAIANDKNEIMPVSVMLNGEYGLNNVCTGVLCLINKNGLGKIIEIDLTIEEKTELLKVNDLFKDIKT